MNERYGSRIEFKQNTKEELLPNFHNDFLYTGTRGYISNNQVHAPWHWHKAVELFYIESGAMEYHTPSGTVLLSEGCGGLVNSGVLHMTKLPEKHSSRCVMLIHLFDTTLITGHTGSRIDQKYIAPITNFSSLDIIPLDKNIMEHVPVLDKIKNSFLLSEKDMGYELRLRSILSDIMVELLMLIGYQDEEKDLQKPLPNEKMKLMMTYVHEHYGEKIAIHDIANAAFVSERECYRSFHAVLHMTPNEYVRKYRLQVACRLLADSTESVTNIAQLCGFGTSSFFGKVFREEYNMTPLEYRSENGKILPR